MTADRFPKTGIRSRRLQPAQGTAIVSVDPTGGDVVRLFSPRRDLWSERFRLNGPLIQPLISIGAATVRLLTAQFA